MLSAGIEPLANLPVAFRSIEARANLSDRQFRKLIADGQLITIRRGLYRKSAGLLDYDLIEIAVAAPQATICLRSALAYHQLIDDIPAEFDIALPRGSWTPDTTCPVHWRHFNPATFTLGRTLVDIGANLQIGLYAPERSLIDAYRMAHLTGADLANDALKRWLRKGGQPSTLLNMANSFPRSLRKIRKTLEILL